MTPISVVGWVGQACFFSRFLVQWIASERVRRSIVPELFWWISIAGSILSALYAWLGPSHDAILVAGYVFNVIVYARNLVLARRPGSRLGPLAVAGLSLAFSVATAFVLLRDPKVSEAFTLEASSWLLVCLIGQVIWAGRFLVQWILAERSGRADLPPVFFGLSLVGSFLLLAYAIHKRDPVLIAGQVPGPIVYGRNLVLQVRTARLRGGAE